MCEKSQYFYVKALKNRATKNGSSALKYYLVRAIFLGHLPLSKKWPARPIQFRPDEFVILLSLTSVY